MVPTGYHGIKKGMGCVLSQLIHKFFIKKTWPNNKTKYEISEINI